MTERTRRRAFIILPRAHFAGEDPFWSERRKFSRWEAYLDLVQLAAFKSTTRTWRGGVVELARGELLASRRFLEPRWGWGVKAISNYLALLQRAPLSLLRLQRETPGGNIYLLIKYDTYSPPGNTYGTTRGHTGAPPEDLPRTEEEEGEGTVRTPTNVAWPEPGDDVVLWIPCRGQRPAQPNGWLAPFRLDGDGGEYGITRAEVDDLETRYGSPPWAPDPKALDVEEELAANVIPWATKQPPDRRPFYTNVGSMLERWLREESAKLGGIR